MRVFTYACLQLVIMTTVTCNNLITEYIFALPSYTRIKVLGF